jgi:hypothetical protein
MLLGGPLLALKIHGDVVKLLGLLDLVVGHGVDVRQPSL